MSKYANLKLSIDSESVDIYIETGGEPVHIAYWHEDEWLEDASIVPAIVNAVHLFHTNPDELIEKVSGVGVQELQENLITPEEILKFKDDWGQSHEEICSCLGYDEDSADDLLVDDYFWIEDDQLWCNKSASGFEGKDELIANFLRYIQ